MASHSQLYLYDEETVDFVEDVNPQILSRYYTRSTKKNFWLNFHGLAEKELIRSSFDLSGIHKLTQWDILELDERPKIEEFSDYIFITFKSINNTMLDQYQTEQISFVLKDNLLISYQEKHGDFFNYVRDRIRGNSGIVRKKSADYLLYLLLEAVLKGYFYVLEEVDEQLEKLRDEVLNKPQKETVVFLENEKAKLKKLKKLIIPFKEQIGKLTVNNSKQIKSENIAYFVELKDQILYLVDELDDYRADVDSITNIYFATISNRANDIMKFLTIMSSLFIPLTFIAGIYGMNFEFMPELKIPNAYPITLVIMLIIVLGLLLYFKRKKWF